MMRKAFIERKTHREDWYGDGEASAKERFPLPPDKVLGSCSRNSKPAAASLFTNITPPPAVATFGGQVLAGSRPRSPLRHKCVCT